MSFARSLSVIAFSLVLAESRLLPAQTCPANPQGGPSEVLFSSTGVSSDLDIGFTGDYHNIKVPAASQLRFCTSNCNATTDPLCDANGGTVTVVGTAFGPPAPVVIGNVAACIVTTFREPPSGTVNVQTGAAQLLAKLDGKAYLQFNASAATKVCPRCNGAAVGGNGTCDSAAANPGTTCVVDQIITLTKFPPGGDPVYALSRQCLPPGAPSATIALDIPFGTGTGVASSCGTQTNSCGASGTAGTCSPGTCTSNGDGIGQACCAGNAAKACFEPTVSRTGAAGAPTPAWPSTTYPKTGNSTIAGAVCVPAIAGLPGLIANPALGLPGPGAMVLPVTERWLGNAAPGTTTSTTLANPTTTSTSLAVPTTTSTTSPVPTTTSTSLPGATTTSTSVPGSSTTSTSTPTATTTSTTLPECVAGTPPPGCDTSNPCKEASCIGGACSYADVTGIAAVSCRSDTVGALIAGSDPTLFGGTKQKAKVVKALGAFQKKLGAVSGTTGKKHTRALKQARASLKTLTGQVSRSKKLDAALKQQLLDALQLASGSLGSLT